MSRGTASVHCRCRGMDDRNIDERAQPPRLKPADADGHTVPASEADESAGNGEERGPEPFSGTMLPPD